MGQRLNVENKAQEKTLFGKSSRIGNWMFFLLSLLCFAMWYTPESTSSDEGFCDGFGAWCPCNAVYTGIHQFSVLIQGLCHKFWGVGVPQDQPLSDHVEVFPCAPRNPQVSVQIKVCGGFGAGCPKTNQFRPGHRVLVLYCPALSP